MAKNKPLQIFGWSMFDFANTSFTVIVVTVVFPIYFEKTICTVESLEIFGQTFYNPSDLFWGVLRNLFGAGRQRERHPETDERPLCSPSTLHRLCLVSLSLNRAARI